MNTQLDLFDTQRELDLVPLTDTEFDAMFPDWDTIAEAVEARREED